MILSQTLKPIVARFTRWYINVWWGRRCDTYDELCYACKAWKAYDEIFETLKIGPVTTTIQHERHGNEMTKTTIITEKSFDHKR